MDDDNELLRRCALHDNDAWRTLVKRYERLVYAIPIREGLTVEQAADVSQETFTILFRNLDAIKQPDRLGSWLMTVARRETWRVSNAAKGERATGIDEDIPVLVIEDFVDEYNQTAAVYSAVLSLGEPCRTLILSMFFDPEEPQYDAIARAIGRPIGSVGPLRSRCLERLRKLLEGDVPHVL